MSVDLDTILSRLEGKTDAEMSALIKDIPERIWTPNPGPQTAAYYCEADELFYGGCVSGDTEYLTPSGWKRIDQYDGGMVAQWDVDGSMSFAIPLGYTNQPCEEMIRFQSRRMDMVLSEDHRVPLYDYQNKFTVKTALQLEANPSRHTIPASFTPDEKGLEYSEDLIRLGVAIHADGSFDGCKENYCRIALRKDRKKTRLTWLLTKLDIEWKEYHNPKRPAEVRYSFYSPVVSKTYKDWWAATQDQLSIVVEEMSHWDGAYSGAVGGDICFNTTIKEDADYIQYAAHSIGRVATISVVEHDNEKWKTGYRVHITKDKRKGVGLRNKEKNNGTKISRVKVDKMYCFKTETSYWIARHSNYIFCTGNSAGGGKSDLMIGLSLMEHSKSLVLRRTNKEALKLYERYEDIVGNDNGLNRSTGIWKFPPGSKLHGKVIDIGGCQLEADKQKRKGIDHSLKAFDEIGDFTKTQYEFIIAWNRSSDPNERCRVLATGNPPTSPEGYWVIAKWGAWLDPKHHNPAEPGELRWYTTGEEGKEIEVDGPGPHMINGEPIVARSRTFIRAKLSDNPDLRDTNYDSVLAALPERERLAYRDGRFDLSVRDELNQCIPTRWIVAANQRWTEKPPEDVPMCAIGVDMSGGCNDPMIIAPRYDGWYAEPIVIEAKHLPEDKLGSTASGHIMMARRDEAIVILDLGGGYGGGAYEHLSNNNIEVQGYKGAEGSTLRAKDTKMPFYNTRSAAIWRMREALDPDQPEGSPISLPYDPEIMADLTAPTYEIVNNKIKVEAKKDVCERILRSTDKGDAVVMAWFVGPKKITHALNWIERVMRKSKHGQQPKIIARNPKRSR